MKIVENLREEPLTS